MSHRKVAFFRLDFCIGVGIVRLENVIVVRRCGRACERVRVRACASAGEPSDRKLLSLKLSDFPWQQAGSATMTFRQNF